MSEQLSVNQPVWSFAGNSRLDLQKDNLRRLREVVITVTGVCLLMVGYGLIRPKGQIARLLPRKIFAIPRPIGFVALAAGCFLLCRTLFFRPLAAHILSYAVYPIRGRSRMVGPVALESHEGSCRVHLHGWNLTEITPTTDRIGPLRIGTEGRIRPIHFGEQYLASLNADTFFRPSHAYAPSWSAEDMQRLLLRAGDGRLIYTWLARPLQESNGQVVVVSFGNGHIVEQISPQTFAPLREAGYHVVVYHPPGYGDTEGPRTPQADFHALEAIVQYLLTQGYQEEQMHLVGYSIGTGAVCAVASHYRVRRVCLLAPYGSIQGVVRRKAQELFGQILGSVIARVLKGTVKENFSYDNLRAVAQAARHAHGAHSLAIYQGGRDDLMSTGLSPSEAEKLRDAWDRWRGGKPACLLTTNPEGGHVFPFDDPVWMQWLPTQIGTV